MLPTSPRERTVEELGQSRHGGGFRLYGYDREGSEGIPIGKLLPLVPTRLMIEVQLRKYRLVMSKVDESDNWAANKAFVPSSGRRFDRRGSFESNGSDSDSDRWTKRKEEEGGRRFASGGGAFDSLIERRGGLLGLWGGLWVYGLKEWSNG
ncbi:hypothetical protein KY285_002284 [Solanum tuberosum]|nr:hypothetical protein KY285_002284 [Solanum tuberosum]